MLFFLGMTCGNRVVVHWLDLHNDILKAWTSSSLCTLCSLWLPWKHKHQGYPCLFIFNIWVGVCYVEYKHQQTMALCRGWRKMDSCLWVPSHVWYTCFQGEDIYVSRLLSFKSKGAFIWNNTPSKAQTDASDVTRNEEFFRDMLLTSHVRSL